MIRARRVVIVLLTVATSAVALAQSPSFDVVSIKRVRDPLARAFGRTVGQVTSGGVWMARDASLVDLVRYAYPNHPLGAQVVGGAEWVRRDMFDVQARGEPGSSIDEWRLMLRAMLAERFRLVAHTERRDLAGYVLVRRGDGKLGKGLTTPTFNCATYRAAVARGETPSGEPGKPTFGDRLPCISTSMPVLDHTRRVPGADWRITAGSTTLPALVSLLARALERPVVDRTELTQVFDVELQYSREVSADGEIGPSLPSAVREQLGLQLDEAVVPTDVLVIDRAEPPTPN